MPFRRLFIILLVANWSGTWAHADPIFSVTELGPSYTLHSDPDGAIHSVSDATGTRTYQFEKLAVTSSITPGNLLPGNPRPSLHAVQTLTSGPYTASNTFWNNGLVFGSVWTNMNGEPPILDLNSSGEVVGAIGVGARFTLAAMKSPETLGGTGGDLLNNYIPQTTNLHWPTSAFKVDEAGRILASGDDHRYYLLTPLALGPPQPVPEPSTLAFCAAAAAACALGRIRGRRAA